MHLSPRLLAGSHTHNTCSPSAPTSICVAPEGEGRPLPQTLRFLCVLLPRLWTASPHVGVSWVGEAFWPLRWTRRRAGTPADVHSAATTASCGPNHTYSRSFCSIVCVPCPSYSGGWVMSGKSRRAELALRCISLLLLISNPDVFLAAGNKVKPLPHATPGGTNLWLVIAKEEAKAAKQKNSSGFFQTSSRTRGLFDYNKGRCERH